ncbi:hypothetical protein GYMLUDRAFT_74895 [Collybiopsis luxurians FD-317 M1]|uniref:Non-ribosomal peptide synthetase n=1 Tax=Collybiopsis luxurians FD-317 M1 TaxID=944289 RepID=A0A0D0CSJ4_9AGAR|nr:hypothetical protein GYMLUDRAFT_74895 [Collybiopsis luxurians FD-317 M1]
MSVSSDIEKHSTDIEKDPAEVYAVAVPSGDVTPTSSSRTGSIHSGDIEKKDSEPKDPQVEQVKLDLELPPKLGYTSFTRWLHHIAFSYYRKTFTVVFAANLIAFIVMVAKNRGTPSAQGVGNAASANLMVTLLFRQENFVNLWYEIATDIVPWSTPLWIRRRLAKVYSYGGFHSGAGVAAVVWYIMYTAVTTKDHIHHPTKWSLANVITSYILILMFCFILGSAHPTFRRKYHDYFEAMHRFAGWVAVCTFWMHQCFAGNQYRLLEPNPPSLGRYLISTSSFWTFVVSSCCTALSWGRLRQVDVYPETLSSHVIRLHFKYRNMKPFYGLKVSDSPVTEWHSYASIPGQTLDGKPDGFSLVVSNAGDWTNRIIHNPPKKLWVRGYPLHGLLYTSKLFRKIVVVATGSGIGPPLSLFFCNYNEQIRVFWSTPAPETTYGPKIIETVKKADPNAWIWDTRKQGRPDMVACTYKMVVESGAEAVYIISNPKLTRKVVYGMESRGIPAYGAIFDS